MQTALAILAAYGLGSISFAIVVSWTMCLPDPRSYGSKNPGATNVLRTGRKAAAVLTLAGDAGKGLAFGWFNFAIGVTTLPASLLGGILYDEFGAGAALEQWRRRPLPPDGRYRDEPSRRAA